MAGSTQAGSFGFAWHKVTLTKTGNIITWDIDDNRIATYDASALTLGGNNIAFGQSDVNTTTAQHPALLFTVFDKSYVSSVTPSGVAGDYNGNGVVDMADYVLWRNRGPLERSELDWNCDSTDYDAWRARFGNISGSGSGLGTRQFLNRVVDALRDGRRLCLGALRRKINLRISCIFPCSAPIAYRSAAAISWRSLAVLL